MKILAIIPLFIVLIASGCTTEVKPYLINASDTMSASVLKFCSDYATETAQQADFTMNGIDTPLYEEFTQVCPVHEKQLERTGTTFYVYYYSECDFSKLDLLKNNDVFKIKSKYLSLSAGKGASIIREKIHTSFIELYENEKRTEDDDLDAIVKDLANKFTDPLLILFLIPAQSSPYEYISDEFVECNESSSCLDMLFQRMETATSVIIRDTHFDNNFITSCENHLKNLDTEHGIDKIKEDIRTIFQKGGYNGNVDEYVSYDSICQRGKTVFSSIYDGVFDGVTEPTQKYFIASTFYRLSKIGDSDTSYNAYMNQILG